MAAADAGHAGAQGDRGAHRQARDTFGQSLGVRLGGGDMRGTAGRARLQIGGGQPHIGGNYNAIPTPPLERHGGPATPSVVNPLANTSSFGGARPGQLGSFVVHLRRPPPTAS